MTLPKHLFYPADRSAAGRQRSVFLLALSLAALSFSCHRPKKLAEEDVHVFLDGCAVLHADGLCELREHRPLRLLITVPEPIQKVELIQGVKTIPATPLYGMGSTSMLLPVRLDPERGPLTLRLYLQGRVSFVGKHVAIQPLKEGEELRQARQSFYDNHLDEARQLFEKRIHWKNERDRLQGDLLLGRLEREVGHAEEARRLLTETQKQAQELGLLSVELNAALALSNLWFEELRLSDAGSVLDRVRAQANRMPTSEALLSAQFVRIFLEQGEFSGVYLYLDKAREQAERYRDPEALSEFHALQSRVLAMHGQYKEALAELNRADTAVQTAALEQPEPCRMAERRAERGHLFLRMRAAGMRPLPDPRPPLLEARSYSEECSKQELVYDILTALARVELFEQQWAAAEGWLREAERKYPSPLRRWQVERSLLLGRIALGRKQQTLAVEGFRQAKNLTQGREAFEAVWEAHVGLGQALEASQPAQPAQALNAYNDAEQLLEERLLHQPLIADRERLITEHDEALHRSLDLLVHLKRKVEAMQYARRMMRRLYLPFAAPSVRESIQSYQQARQDWERAYERAASSAVSLPGQALRNDDEKTLAEKVTQAGRKLQPLLHEAFPSGGEMPLRPPAEGEVLLLCHAGPDGVLCLAQERQVYAVHLPKLDVHVPPAILAQQLLGPPQEPLRRAQRLIALGKELLPLDIYALPFRTGVLGQFLEVVHGLDLPAQQPVPRSPGRDPAWVFGPCPGRGALDARDDGRSLESIARLLRPAYEVTSHCAPSTPSQKRAHEITQQTAEGLGAEIALSELLVFIGGIEPATDVWSQPRLITGGSGLLVSDLLLRSRAPRHVILMPTEVPASEIVAWPMLLGPEQAFLLRGSAGSLTTMHPLTEQVATELIQALLAEGELQRPDGNLTVAVRKARQRLSTDRTRLASPRGGDMLAAFATVRVFVP
jgi:tetratricopeptide (TPR) repeat protein